MSVELIIVFLNKLRGNLVKHIETLLLLPGTPQSEGYLMASSLTVTDGLGWIYLYRYNILSSFNSDYTHYSSPHIKYLTLSLYWQPSIGPSVWTIKTRASGVGRCGAHLTVNIKSIDPHVLNFPAGTDSGKHARSVISQMSAPCQWIHTTSLLTGSILLPHHQLKMKNLPLVQNGFIETGASSGYLTLKNGYTQTHMRQSDMLGQITVENSKVYWLHSSVNHPKVKFFVDSGTNFIWITRLEFWL